VKIATMDRLSASTPSALSHTRSLDAARWLQARFNAPLVGQTPKEYFRRTWPKALNIESVEKWLTKAAIGAAGSAWGEDLVSPPDLMAGIVDLERQQSLLGRIRPLARVVPLNTRVNTVTSAAGGFRWVGGGRSKPLNRWAFDSTVLGPAIASGISVVTQELLRFIGGEVPLRDLLVDGSVEFIDQSFVDPSNSGSVDPAAPASITSGVTAIASTGDPVEDLRTLLQRYEADGGRFASIVILLSSANAAALALRNGADGNPIYPNLDVRGGVLAGCPCFASEALEDQMVAIDAKRLLVADSGLLDVTISTWAALEMSDSPAMDASTPTSANIVSMGQTDSAALRLDRWVNWAYTGAVAVIDGVDYLREGGSPA
jgi:hypothetical protein